MVNRYSPCYQCSDHLIARAGLERTHTLILLDDFSLIVKAAPHECENRASSDCIIHFNKKKVGTKSLICQTMIVNNNPDFPSVFYKYFAKNFGQCINPTHFEHALYVHAESFFNKN